MTGGGAPDITPRGEAGDALPPACPECPIADVLERREREARTAAWAGILVAVMGVLSCHCHCLSTGAELLRREHRRRRDPGRMTQNLLAAVALAGVVEVPLSVVMNAPIEVYPTVGGTTLGALSIIELVRRRTT